MKYYEKTLKSETLFKGRILTLKHDTVELCNGKEAKREIVEHPGGVGIVAKTPGGKIILVNQFRKPFEKEIFEIPAGMLEYHEDHREAGLRELEEETGYKAGFFEYLGGYYASPGFTTEIIHLYFADNLTKTQVNPDEDEFLDIIEEEPAKVYKMLENNEICDAKTVIGLLFTKHRFEV